MPPASLTIAPDAAQYVRDRGGSVVLRSTVKHGCCGGRVELVKAEVGDTSDASVFDRFAVDGVTVFVECGLVDELVQPLRIGLDRLFRLRSLYVEGAPARM